MAGTRAPEPVVVDVEGLTSEPYVAITLEALAAFGIGGQLDERWSSQRGRYEIDPIRGRFTHRDLVVEGDYSAAAYPAAAAALTGGSVTLVGLRRASSQGDRGFLDLLSQMGAEVDWHDSGDGERLIVRGTGRLAAVDVDLSAMPDQVPTLAALAAFAEGVTTIRNVPHLRLKESDRLQAMAIELTKAGVEVEELADGLRIHGLETAIRAGSEGPVGRVVVDPHDDHRIAMSMALVGLRRPGVEISRPQVVAKSYPDFWRDLSVLVAKA
jgi:3-phosphoshikimate 1-carboxyvinyltransferase